MSVSIVTFADLGEESNLKTPGIIPVIDKFIKEGELDQIICRRAKNFYFKNTKPAINSLLFLISKMRSFLPGFSPVRSWEFYLIDAFASKNIQKSNLVFFHPPFYYENTVLKVKQNNSIVVGIETNAHLLYAQCLLKEECLRLDIPFIKSKNITTYKRAIRNLDYIIAFSDFIKKSYTKYGFPVEKIFVANTDINSNKFHPIISEKKVFKALYVSHTTTLKGLHYLLNAWINLGLENAELLLVGDFHNTPKILTKRYKKIIDSDKSISYVGFSSDALKYYNQASLFVFPSLTEGNPKVVMEAMACGLPVITTQNAKSIVEDGKSGFIVPIRDSVALQEKIKFLYYNKDRAEEMGREARKAVENKKSFGDQVFEIYQEILKRENI